MIDLYASGTKHLELVVVKSWPTTREGSVVAKVVSSDERAMPEGLAAFNRRLPLPTSGGGRRPSR